MRVRCYYHGDGCDVGGGEVIKCLYRWDVPVNRQSLC